MFGSGLLKGLGVTIKHFVETYVDDVKTIPSRYAGGQDLIRQAPDERGLFTIQYPEEKRELPERFRYIPMLIYDTAKKEDRCTACGICAKVCPPQCIWIVRDKDEKGKPIPRPSEFYIDASICMSCGFCAEFCPFDAIKMNHDYELAVYQRYPALIYDKAELTVPVEYYAALYPTQYVEEETRRAEEEAKKAKKPGREKAPAPAAAAPAPAPAAPTPAAPAAPIARTSTAISAEELERRRAEAKARSAARKGGEAEAAAPAAAAAQEAAATARTSSTLSAEELERRRAEAKARSAARKGGEVEAAAPAAAAAAPVAPSAPAPPVARPAAPAAPAAVVAGFGKPLAATARSSRTLAYEELERRRVEGYTRYKARKGADAKALHGAAAPTAAPAMAEPQPATPPPVVAQPPAVAAPPPPAAVKPAAPAAAKVAGAYGKPLLASARHSGALAYEELERRRAESYARYKARKGADAKELHH